MRDSHVRFEYEPPRSGVPIGRVTLEGENMGKVDTEE